MLRRKMSKAAKVDDAGVLHCPKCGGTQFESKRSGFGKSVGAGIGLLSLGVGAVAIAAAPKTRVRCVTCGKTFTRG